GTFAYNPSCENVTMSQRTCRKPEARSLGYICDYIRCECLQQKYWDEAANKCVQLEECSDQSKVFD
ncbi:putative protease inhibitor 4, partial [Operophtera brumata]